MWLRSAGFLFQAVFSFLSPKRKITRKVQYTMTPFFAAPNMTREDLPKLSVKDSSNSSGSATSDEATSKQVLNRMKLTRQELEELLFLKCAMEMLKDFRKKLLEQRWD